MSLCCFIMCRCRLFSNSRRRLHAREARSVEVARHRATIQVESAYHLSIGHKTWSRTRWWSLRSSRLWKRLRLQSRPRQQPCRRKGTGVEREQGSRILCILNQKLTLGGKGDSPAADTRTAAGQSACGCGAPCGSASASRRGGRRGRTAAHRLERRGRSTARPGARL